MPSEVFDERLTRRLLLQGFYMLTRQIGREGKWDQGKDGTAPDCPHFAHQTRMRKWGTLLQSFPPHCPSPEQLSRDWIQIQNIGEQKNTVYHRSIRLPSDENTEIPSYLRSQPSTPGLSLSLLGSEEAERFSLARARSPSVSRGVHGAEGEWKPSKCGGRVSVSSRRSSESTVSVITPSVFVLSTVTPLMLHWLPASSTWGRKPRNIFENEKKTPYRAN